MGLKSDPFFLDLAPLAEGVYLITAAIGKHGSRPPDKLMQPAGLFEHVHTWAQVQVVGITQYDLRTNIVFQFGLMNRLDGTCCTYGHEDRSLNTTVGSMDLPGPGCGSRVGML